MAPQIRAALREPAAAAALGEGGGDAELGLLDGRHRSVSRAFVFQKRMPLIVPTMMKMMIEIAAAVEYCCPCPAEKASLYV